MALHFKNQDGTRGAAWQGERINGILYQRNIEFLWTDAELAEIGLGRTVYGDLQAGNTPGAAKTRIAYGDETWNDAAKRFEGTRTLVDDTVDPADIDAERDRRLDLDFQFNGKQFQRDPVAIRRITGAGALALGAIVAGAQPGDYQWHGGANPFAWIASDNSLVQMDAQTVYAFAAAAANVETALVMKAKALKAMSPIPADYTQDIYWI